MRTSNVRYVRHVVTNDSNLQTPSVRCSICILRKSFEAQIDRSFSIPQIVSDSGRERDSFTVDVKLLPQLIGRSLGVRQRVVQREQTAPTAAHSDRPIQQLLRFLVEASKFRMHLIRRCLQIVRKPGQQVKRRKFYPFVPRRLRRPVGAGWRIRHALWPRPIKLIESSIYARRQRRNARQD